MTENSHAAKAKSSSIDWVLISTSAGSAIAACLVVTVCGTKVRRNHRALTTPPNRRITLAETFSKPPIINDACTPEMPISTTSTDKPPNTIAIFSVKDPVNTEIKIQTPPQPIQEEHGPSTVSPNFPTPGNSEAIISSDSGSDSEDDPENEDTPQEKLAVVVPNDLSSDDESNSENKNSTPRTLASEISDETPDLPTALRTGFWKNFLTKLMNSNGITAVIDILHKPTIDGSNPSTATRSSDQAGPNIYMLKHLDKKTKEMLKTLLYEMLLNQVNELVENANESTPTTNNGGRILELLQAMLQLSQVPPGKNATNRNEITASTHITNDPIEFDPALMNNYENLLKKLNELADTPINVDAELLERRSAHSSSGKDTGSESEEETPHPSSSLSYLVDTLFKDSSKKIKKLLKSVDAQEEPSLQGGF